MSLEGLDGGGAVRETSDGWEALHGEMKGVTVLIAGSVGRRGGWGGPQGADTNTCVHKYTQPYTHTHTQDTTWQITETQRHARNQSNRHMRSLSSSNLHKYCMFKYLMRIRVFKKKQKKKTSGAQNSHNWYVKKTNQRRRQFTGWIFTLKKNCAKLARFDHFEADNMFGRISLTAQIKRERQFSSINGQQITAHAGHREFHEPKIQLLALLRPSPTQHVSFNNGHKSTYLQHATF